MPPIVRRALIARRVAVAVLALLLQGAAGAQIVGARYAEPVDRYGHFAPGRPHEYARLIVDFEHGSSAAFTFDDDVFEDVTPRLVHLAPGSTQVLTIVSGRPDGSRLVLFEVDEQRLSIAAQSMPIGTPRRWLNPVGVADLEGDGRSEIVAVITPHVDGVLRVYRRDRDRLIAVANLGDVSNHVYGTPELGLSALVAIDGRIRIVVPDQKRRVLRVIAFAQERLAEIGRCATGSAVIGPIETIRPGEIRVGLADGPRTLRLGDCLRAP